SHVPNPPGPPSGPCADATVVGPPLHLPPACGERSRRVNAAVGGGGAERSRWDATDLCAQEPVGSATFSSPDARMRRTHGADQEPEPVAGGAPSTARVRSTSSMERRVAYSKTRGSR